MKPSTVKLLLGLAIVGGLAWLAYVYVYQPISAAYNATSPSGTSNAIATYAMKQGLSPQVANEIGTQGEATFTSAVSNLLGPLAPVVTIPGNFITQQIFKAL